MIKNNTKKKKKKKIFILSFFFKFTITHICLIKIRKSKNNSRNSKKSPENHRIILIINYRHMKNLTKSNNLRKNNNKRNKKENSNKRFCNISNTEYFLMIFFFFLKLIIYQNQLSSFI
jgi:hypothetical protein